MNNNETRYWFPAKRYGWGWGLAATWEGWLVFVTYLGLVFACAFLVFPHSRAVGFSLIGLLSLALVLICYTKGEPSGWRWG
jgi:hypothetical protein